MSHARAVPASPCAGTDGWAILAEPPGVRDLADDRYWETSLDRSRRRRGSRPVRFRGGPELRVAAALAVTALVAPGVAGASSRDLSRGSSGAAVQQLQAKLGITADGAFGPQTEAAVRAFQRSHGLPVTGLVGPLTRAALGEGSTDATASASQALNAIRADGAAPEPAQPTASSKGAAAVQAALSKVGASYSYGATGPSSFDCSGLVMWAFRQAGMSMPHSSFAQYGLGQSVSRDQIQAGDLVFFNTAGAGASDVGIATSPTTAVSATTHGVMTHAILDDYWGSHFVGARRVA
ncbi:MAG TPA: NlpC/P60 family protein [Thermoleophilaceae bacterium]